MRVVGFNFDKISVEKFKDRAQQIKINTNIDISEINPIESDLLKIKESLVQVKFSYKIKYEPEYAEIGLKGTAIISMDEKQAKEVAKEWKKKQMPEEFSIFLFNVLIRKSSLRALSLEDELNLPLHMPMPALNQQKPQKEK
ncbi:MAG: hypothetical protein AABX79_02770 [Nanoarchaeota archaeon]